MPPESSFNPSEITIHANGFENVARLKKTIIDYFLSATQTALVGHAFFDQLKPYRSHKLLSPYHKGQFDTDNEANNDYLVVPVYGPLHRNGVVYLPYAKFAENKDDVIQLQSQFQAAHQRYAENWETPEKFKINLSEREHQVLTWLAAGKSNIEISGIIGLSPHTVDAYIRRVFAKLSANNRVTAAIRALGLGLLNESVVHLNMGFSNTKTPNDD